MYGYQGVKGGKEKEEDRGKGKRLRQASGSEDSELC